MREGCASRRRATWPRRATLALATLVLVIGTVATPAAADERFTYSVTSQGGVTADLDQVAAVARTTLADPRGWSLGSSITFDEVSSGGDFQIVLASPDVVASAAPVCSPDWSCRVGDRVLINDVRWRTGTSSWTRSLDEYQSYLINHETGHWLGLRHDGCSSPGAAAPVMQQQSISLDGCVANVWPLEGERDAVAARHGADNRYDSGGVDDDGSDDGELVRRGDRGSAVTAWQQSLQDWNPEALPAYGADGVFGPETEGWTIRFQRAQDITVDGIVGPETRGAMQAVD